MLRIDYSVTIFDIAKIQIIIETTSFWITFLSFGMMMKFASETTKPFVDDYLLSEESRDAVTHNYLHIHDKDYYPTKSLTCVQHPLDIILQHGFTAHDAATLGTGICTIVDA